MARQLRVHGAQVVRPVGVSPPEARKGPYVALEIVSDDLKGKPLHLVPLTDAEVIRLASYLLDALRAKNGDYA